MNIALKLGVFLVIAGSVMGVIGSLGKLFLSAKNAIGLVKTATLGMNTAFLASPITWVIAGIVALSLSRMKMRRWKRYRESLRVKAFL